MNISKKSRKKKNKTESSVNKPTVWPGADKKGIFEGKKNGKAKKGKREKEGSL